MLGSIAYFFLIWSWVILFILIFLIWMHRFLPSWIRLWVLKVIAYVIAISYIVGFFHYTLPQRDIVKVIDAYEKRMDVSQNSLFWGQPDSGTNFETTRDVRFIDAELPDGSVMVYRNEDTGLGWPPYFKFDSSDVSAEAKQLIAKDNEEQWVAIRHYGWRNRLFSLFPNAVSMKPVAGPDVQLIPWFNIIFFVIFGLLSLGAFRLMQKFRRKRVDPMLDNLEDGLSDIGDGASTMGDRMRGFFKGLGRK